MQKISTEFESLRQDKAGNDVVDQLADSLKALQENLNKLENNTNTSVDELIKSVNDSIEKSTKEINENIEKLDKQTSKSIKHLNEKAAESIGHIQKQIESMKEITKEDETNSNTIVNSNNNIEDNNEMQIIVNPSNAKSWSIMQPEQDDLAPSGDSLSEEHVFQMMRDISNHCSKMIHFHEMEYRNAVCNKFKAYKYALTSLQGDLERRLESCGVETAKETATALEAIKKMLGKIDAIILDNEFEVAVKPIPKLSYIQVIENTAEELKSLRKKVSNSNYKPTSGEYFEIMVQAMEKYLLVKRLRAYLPEKILKEEEDSLLQELENASLALLPDAAIWKSKMNTSKKEDQVTFNKIKETSKQKINQLIDDVQGLNDAEDSVIDFSIETPSFEKEILISISGWLNNHKVGHQIEGYHYVHHTWDQHVPYVINIYHEKLKANTSSWQHLIRRLRTPQERIGQLLSAAFSSSKRLQLA